MHAVYFVMAEDSPPGKDAGSLKAAPTFNFATPISQKG